MLEILTVVVCFSLHMPASHITQHFRCIPKINQSKHFSCSSALPISSALEFWRSSACRLRSGREMCPGNRIALLLAKVRCEASLSRQGNLIRAELGCVSQVAGTELPILASGAHAIEQRCRCPALCTLIFKNCVFMLILTHSSTPGLVGLLAKWPTCR